MNYIATTTASSSAYTMRAETGTTWRVQISGSWVGPDGVPVPLRHAVNPWFWRGRRVGILLGRIWYFGR